VQGRPPARLSGLVVPLPSVRADCGVKGRRHGRARRAASGSRWQVTIRQGGLGQGQGFHFQVEPGKVTRVPVGPPLAPKVEAKPDCIGKGRIPCVYSRLTYRVEFQAGETCAVGGHVHCGKRMTR
jgi:hypothetical protein